MASRKSSTVSTRSSRRGRKPRRRSRLASAKSSSSSGQSEEPAPRASRFQQSRKGVQFKGPASKIGVQERSIAHSKERRATSIKRTPSKKKVGRRSRSSSTKSKKKRGKKVSKSRRSSLKSSRIEPEAILELLTNPKFETSIEYVRLTSSPSSKRSSSRRIRAKKFSAPINSKKGVVSRADIRLQLPKTSPRALSSKSFKVSSTGSGSKESAVSKTAPLKQPNKTSRNLALVDPLKISTRGLAAARKYRLSRIEEDKKNSKTTPLKQPKKTSESLALVDPLKISTRGLAAARKYRLSQIEEFKKNSKPTPLKQPLKKSSDLLKISTRGLSAARKYRLSQLEDGDRNLKATKSLSTPSLINFRDKLEDLRSKYVGEIQDKPAICGAGRPSIPPELKADLVNAPSNDFRVKQPEKSLETQKSRPVLLNGVEYQRWQKELARNTPSYSSDRSPNVVSSPLSTQPTIVAQNSLPQHISKPLSRGLRSKVLPPATTTSTNKLYDIETCKSLTDVTQSTYEGTLPRTEQLGSLCYEMLRQGHTGKMLGSKSMFKRYLKSQMNPIFKSTPTSSSSSMSPTEDRMNEKNGAEDLPVNLLSNRSLSTPLSAPSTAESYSKPPLSAPSTAKSYSRVKNDDRESGDELSETDTIPNEPPPIMEKEEDEMEQREEETEQIKGSQSLPAKLNGPKKKRRNMDPKNKPKNSSKKSYKLTLYLNGKNKKEAKNDC